VDVHQLFLETLSELENRIGEGRTEYDFLMAAGLLRKLLTDGNPLVHQVNRSVRMKLEFDVTEEVVMPPGFVPVYAARLEGISPHISTPSFPHKTVSLDGFLREVVVRLHGRPVTVHQVIDQVAHIEGGVHRGDPRDEHERLLRDVGSAVGFDGVPLIAHTLRGIGLVVVDALRGLAEQVREV
jgi:hypothetical protein